MGLYEEMLGLASKDTVAIEEGMIPGADAPQPGQTVERARQFAEESTPAGAFARSAMSSVSAGLANPLIDAVADALGIPQEFTAAEKLQILEEQFPKASLAGGVAGAVTPLGAPSMTGRALTALTAKAAPMVQKGARVAGDVALGALQAGADGKDVVEGAAAGLIGSGAGEVAGAVASPGAQAFKKTQEDIIRASVKKGSPIQRVLDSVNNLQKSKIELQTKISDKISELDEKLVIGTQKGNQEINKLKKDLNKARKDAADVQRDIDLGKYKQGTPEHEAAKAANEGAKAAEDFFSKQEQALDGLMQKRLIETGKERKTAISSAKAGIEQATKNLQKEQTQARLVQAIRNLAEESDESIKAYKKQLKAAKKSERKRAAQREAQKAAAEAPAEETIEEVAKPALSDFRYTREQSEAEKELLEDAYATGFSLRALAEQVGIPFQTLQKKIKNKYGITRESAEKAVAERAAKAEAQAAEAAAAAKEAPAPELEPLAAKVPRPKPLNLLDVYQSTPSTIRKSLEAQSGSPIKVEAAQEELARQQAKLAEARQPGMFDIDESAFSEAIQAQKSKVAQAQQDLQQKLAVKEQAEAAFKAAPSPAGEEALMLAKEAVANAEDALTGAMQQQAGRGAAMEARKQAATAPMRQQLSQTDQQLSNQLDELARLEKISMRQLKGFKAILASADQEAKAMVRNLVYQQMQQPEQQLTNQ